MIYLSAKASKEVKPYAAVIDDGNISDSDQNSDSIHIQGLGYDIISGDGVSQIIINQKDYSPDEDGINVVVYDKKLQMIVDTVTY